MTLQSALCLRFGTFSTGRWTMTSTSTSLISPTQELSPFPLPQGGGPSRPHGRACSTAFGSTNANSTACNAATRLKSRSFVIAVALIAESLESCGTIQATSPDQPEVPFQGVRHDLAAMSRTEELDPQPTDLVTAACAGICLGVPAVLNTITRLIDLPFSFVADLGVMSWRYLKPTASSTRDTTQPGPPQDGVNTNDE